MGSDPTFGHGSASEREKKSNLTPLIAGSGLQDLTPNHELHPRLAADTHRLGRLDLSLVLLHRDAGVPWYLLVPDVGAVEMIDLAAAEREQLNAEIQCLGEFVREIHQPARLNIAAIGNQVPQLHVHVIARHEHDPCWPGVVWGRLATEYRYTDAEVDARRAALAERLAMRTEEAED